MLGWLFRVIVGNFKSHQHEWVIIAEGPWSDKGMGTNGRYYTLQCYGCGDVKKESL